MVYEEFLTTVQQHLQHKLGTEYTIRIRRVPKNNGLFLDGLSIAKQDSRIAPTIYLNYFYDCYQEGTSLEEIEKQLLDAYMNHCDLSGIHLERLSEFDALKDRILFKLIHAESNLQLLSDLPFIPFLDLAIVFYLYLDDTEHGQMTSLIHNGQLISWVLSTEQLYELAKENAQRLFPAELKTMQDVMKEIAVRRLGSDYEESFIEDLFSNEEGLSPLYVLTNTKGILGACCMLYDNVIKDFANSLEQDLVILPSSIHEVLIIPYDNEVDCDSLSEMVTEINQAEVPDEDQLSNQIYLYERSTGHYSILSNSPSLVGASASTANSNMNS